MPYLPGRITRILEDSYAVVNLYGDKKIDRVGAVSKLTQLQTESTQWDLNLDILPVGLRILDMIDDGEQDE